MLLMLQSCEVAGFQTQCQRRLWFHAGHGCHAAGFNRIFHNARRTRISRYAEGNGVDKQLKINKTNYDVLQIVDVPVNAQITMAVTGKGDALGQVVRRFNEPAVDTAPAAQMLAIDVKYDTTAVEVNDLVKVSVNLASIHTGTEYRRGGDDRRGCLHTDRFRAGDRFHHRHYAEDAEHQTLRYCRQKSDLLRK